MPKKYSTQQRLSHIPKMGTELTHDVRILWNEYQVPYIIAKSDEDAAFALGVVHAHLRLGQLEVAKRLAYGRLSEMFGPFTRDVDEALRILAPARSAHLVFEKMPRETKAWLDRYVDGINHYKFHLTKDNTPHEYRLLGMDPKEKWRDEDSIAIGRLFGTDVNWLSWLDMLPQSTQEDFARVWSYMHDVGGNGTVSFTDKPQGGIGKIKKDLKKLKNILRDTQKSGSNSIVISKERSSSGGALIANDPHLGFMIPNAWMMAGMKSPSYEIVGMMPPGVPAFGFGRTRHLAWGGTNMRALSSDMVDVSSLDENDFESHEEIIKSRFWFDKKITVRKSEAGPIISDAKIFPTDNKNIAVRWVGHDFSDEITSLLNAMKAKDWPEFRGAFDEFAIPAQNFLYAGEKGDIGYVLATKLAKRTPEHKHHLVTPYDVYQKSWEEIYNASQLPFAYQPKEGFLASANNRPVGEIDYPIGYFFPQDERIRRIKQIFTGKKKWSLDELKDVQRDAVSLTSLEIKDMVMEKIGGKVDRWGKRSRAVYDVLKDWDGSYAPDNKGAYVFTAFLLEYAPLVYKHLKRPHDYEAFKNDAYFRDLFKRDLIQIEDKRAAVFARHAMKRVYFYYADNKTWGDIQRLGLTHFLGRAPVLKYFYKEYDFAHGGTRETIMKAAHPLTMEKHKAYYGAQSRQLSDMADIDANYFVLVGGQDGFPGSANFMDQSALFVQGEYVQMPLSDEKITELFPYQTVLKSK